MKKLLSTVALALTVSVLAPRASDAQFQPGYSDIGPTLGLGGIGDASISIGGRFEKGIKPLEDLGGGILGIMVGAEYYSWSNSFFSYTYIPVGVTANYHFRTVDEKFDPFLGLGLGFQIISCDYKGSGIDVCDSSAIYFIGRAGARYFLQEKMALYADVGAGAATLNVGLMFRLK